MSINNKKKTNAMGGLTTNKNKNKPVVDYSNKLRI